MRKLVLQMITIAISTNLLGCALAKGQDPNTLPIVSLGVVEEVINKSDPRYVQYLVFICATENLDWKFDSFEVSHSLKEPKLLASQVFNSGQRDGGAVIQPIRISEDYLNVGDVTISIAFSPTAKDGHKAVVVDLSDLLRTGKYEKYTIEESLVNIDFCSLAKPLEEHDMKISFGAKIH